MNHAERSNGIVPGTGGCYPPRPIRWLFTALCFVLVTGTALAQSERNFPADQLDFLEAHKAADLQILLAGTPRERDSLVRAWESRAKQLLKPGRILEGWIGEVAEVKETAPDQFTLSVRFSIDEKRTVSFSNNGPSAPRMDAAQSDLALVKKLAPGQQIALSGIVSMTKDGKMILLASGDSGITDNPVYLFEFKQILSVEEMTTRLAEARRQAEDAERRNRELIEAASKPPPADISKLLPGKYYRLDGGTPLHAQFAPADATQPATGIAATPESSLLAIIPGGTMVFIHSAQANGEFPWYNVTANLAGAQGNNRGWIDARDLKDQVIHEYIPVTTTPIPTAIQAETSYQNRGASAPTAPRKPRPGDIREVYIRSNARDDLYHASGCPQLTGQIQKIHIYEATNAGYKPDPRCFDTSR